MSNLEIADLKPAGAELFEDNENYIQDLTDEEMTDLAGALGSRYRSIVNVNVNASIFGPVSIFAIITVNGNTVGNGLTVVGNGLAAVTRR